MTKTRPAKLNTVGVISAQLGIPISKVEYIIRARNIESIGMAGNARLFDADAVETIARELSKIAKSA